MWRRSKDRDRRIEGQRPKDQRIEKQGSKDKDRKIEIEIERQKAGDRRYKDMNDNYVTFEIEKAKHIALVAHDGKKKELVDWCDRNKEILKSHFLCGTGTTARLIAEKTGLPVKGYNSGPLGGDQQIGAKIVEGQIDFMIFLWDPLEAQPHDPDVKALLRIAVVYDIPIANNLATADFMLNSRYMTQTYSRRVQNFNKTVQERVEKMK